MELTALGKKTINIILLLHKTLIVIGTYFPAYYVSDTVLSTLQYYLIEDNPKSQLGRAKYQVPS